MGGSASPPKKRAKEIILWVEVSLSLSLSQQVNLLIRFWTNHSTQGRSGRPDTANQLRSLWSNPVSSICVQITQLYTFKKRAYDTRKSNFACIWYANPSHLGLWRVDASKYHALPWTVMTSPARLSLPQPSLTTKRVIPMLVHGGNMVYSQ